MRKLTVAEKKQLDRLLAEAEANLAGANTTREKIERMVAEGVGRELSDEEIKARFGERRTIVVFIGEANEALDASENATAATASESEEQR
jgi:hypothetical protein